MNFKKLNRFCPVCHNNTGNKLGDVKMMLGENVRLPKSYDIVTCEKCGFAFADTESSQEDYNEYYDSDNCYSYNGEIKSTTMQQLVSCTTDFFCRNVQRSEKILDIGCGAGDFLISLKEKGYHNLCGLDPLQTSIDRLKKAGIKGIKKNIFDIWEDKEIFDVITFTGVLEHICDLEGFLKIILSHLKKGGKIFVVVPAVEGFERFFQHKANYFNHEHINYFSHISLNNLFERHGCKSIEGNQGEFCTIENNYGVKDLILQNIFCYQGETEYQQNKDNVSQMSITNFLVKYKREEQRILTIIEKLTVNNKKCIVWGAGSLSMQLMSNEGFAEKVAFFVDNNMEKVGKDIAGKRIYAPDMLQDGQNSDLIIVVACMQHNDDIVRQIDEMKIMNEILVY